MSLKALQEYTYWSKYARHNKAAKRRETWYEAVSRVEEMHLRRYPQIAKEIKWAFDQVRTKRVLGSQRALQFGGEPIERKNARLYNCTAAYCDRMRFFQEAFWLLLCGCGVGFSVQRQHVAKLPDFHTDLSFSKGKRVFQVPDTIEGWADALGVLLATYMPHPDYAEWYGYEVVFDFSLIRLKGSTLASGVGKAPGPDPLRESLNLIRGLMTRLVAAGQTRLRSIDAYDIVMHASDAVLSGGVRRSATLCMFSFDDMEMIKAKTGNWMAENPQRGRSNNSAVLVRGKGKWEEFYALIESVRQFGEPGFIWVENEEALYNPCVEIGLYGYDEEGNSGWDFCNLCEINGKKLKTKADFEIAARAAAIIGTCQSGYTDFDYLGAVSKRIVDKEALLGVSITGMMDHPEIAFDAEMQREMARLIIKINAELAPRIGVNPTARATCVKPSGTASCVLGTASGVHPHHAKRYLRRSQANKLESVLAHFKTVNPRAVEQSMWKDTDEIVTFCVEVEDGAKVKNNIKAIELLDYVKLTQQNWVASGRVKDRCAKPWLMHNVSNTITVEDHEWDDVARYIFDNQKFFAGISLLSHTGDLDFPQAPMCTVHTQSEIAKMYGPGVLFLDGLIDRGHDAFDNLFDACSALMGMGKPLSEPVKPEPLYIEDRITADGVYATLCEQYKAQQDWIAESKEMATNYFDGDMKQLTYAMKEVENWWTWCELTRTYKDVDYTSMVEEEDTTKPMQEWACSGGTCQLI